MRARVDQLWDAGWLQVEPNAVLLMRETLAAQRASCLIITAKLGLGPVPQRPQLGQDGTPTTHHGKVVFSFLPGNLRSKTLLARLRNVLMTKQL